MIKNATEVVANPLQGQFWLNWFVHYEKVDQPKSFHWVGRGNRPEVLEAQRQNHNITKAEESREELLCSKNLTVCETRRIIYLLE